MDKRYYYRILGVREGSSTVEIKKAYDRHMRRLALPDYADDPEYVVRKKDQIRHAYSVLVGGNAAAAIAKEKVRYEKRKDAEDAGEDAISDLKKKFKKHVRGCEEKTEMKISLAQVKETINETLGTNVFSMDYGKTKPATDEQQKKILKLIVSAFVSISIFGSLITSCAGMAVDIAGDVFDGIGQAIPEPEFFISEEDAASAEHAIDPEAVEWMDHIVMNCHLYDFYGNLDFDTQNDFLDQVEWDPGDETASEIWGEMTDLAFYLGLDSSSDIVWYVTGDEDFYWETDDFGNAAMVVILMNPPAFDEIAGAVNLYSGEVILDYADYLRFLGDVAMYQTEELMGEFPVLD